jgi:hypothetical protein
VERVPSGSETAAPGERTPPVVPVPDPVPVCASAGVADRLAAKSSEVIFMILLLCIKINPTEATSFLKLFNSQHELICEY